MAKSYFVRTSRGRSPRLSDRVRRRAHAIHGGRFASCPKGILGQFTTGGCGAPSRLDCDGMDVQPWVCGGPTWGGLAGSCGPAVGKDRSSGQDRRPRWEAGSRYRASGPEAAQGNYAEGWTPFEAGEFGTHPRAERAGKAAASFSGVRRLVAASGRRRHLRGSGLRPASGPRGRSSRRTASRSSSSGRSWAGP